MKDIHSWWRERNCGDKDSHGEVRLRTVALNKRIPELLDDLHSAHRIDYTDIDETLQNLEKNFPD